MPQFLVSTTNRGRHFDYRCKRPRILAEILERLCRIFDHTREFVDFSKFVSAGDVLAGHAHPIDIRKPVRQPRDHRQIVARACPRFPGFEIENFDACHSREKPCVVAVNLNCLGAVTVPQFGAAGRGIQCPSCDFSGNADNAVLADAAASIAEHRIGLGARLKDNASFCQQGEGGGEYLFKLLFSQQTVWGSWAMVQATVLWLRSLRCHSQSRR